MADWLGDFLGLNKGKATTAAADQNRGILDQVNQQGTGYLTQANDANKSLLDSVMGGSTLYSDALGINGPGGNTNATAAFQHSPGYTQGIDEATQALMRTASSRGDLGGGEVGIDLGKYIVGASNNDYGNWLTRLGGFQQQLPGATAQYTGGLNNLTQFGEDIGSGQMAANNQAASGNEAGQGGLWSLLGNVAGVAGTAVGAATGLNKPKPAFTGYGTY